MLKETEHDKRIRCMEQAVKAIEGLEYSKDEAFDKWKEKFLMFCAKENLT